MNKHLVMVLLYSSVVLITCEDRPRTNPFDPDTDPDAWAPSNLQAEVINDSQIKLTWTQEEERIFGFRIERKAGNGSFSEIDTVGADVTEFLDTGLTVGTVYSYRVKAFTDANESDYVETTVNFWKDCNGAWGGTAVEDCSGICNGDAIEDCSGICNGDAIEDCSGICNGVRLQMIWDISG